MNPTPAPPFSEEGPERVLVFLSLGSNTGNRRALLSRAVRLLGERVGPVVRRSSLHETEPWGFASPHLFLNACVAVETVLTPRQLLEATQQIERELGRVRKTAPADSSAALPRYHDRPIDIDILLYGDLTVDEPDLQIPHPLMQERDFVMRPLREIL